MAECSHVPLAATACGAERRVAFGAAVKPTALLGHESDGRSEPQCKELGRPPPSAAALQGRPGGRSFQTSSEGKRAARGGVLPPPIQRVCRAPARTGLAVWRTPPWAGEEPCARPPPPGQRPERLPPPPAPATGSTWDFPPAERPPSSPGRRRKQNARDGARGSRFPPPRREPCSPPRGRSGSPALKDEPPCLSALSPSTSGRRSKQKSEVGV